MGKKIHKEIIERSHKRSKDLGIEQDRVFPKYILGNEELNKLFVEHAGLLDVARPLTDKLYEALTESDFIIILTDNEGCILYVKGDAAIEESAAKLNMIPGAYMDEKSIGTNAMGTALKENTPVQITAQEHFISAYHKWTCSAAPIHNIDGSIIGSLNLTGHKDKVHPHTLGLVVAAAKAIENKIESHFNYKQLYDANQYAFAMMNNLSYGVFAIDLNDDIHWANDTACRAINIQRSKLIDEPVTDIFPDWIKIKHIILNELLFMDEECSFSIPELKERFLFNAFIITAENKDIVGYLLTFKPYSRVLKLAKKYSGQHAYFTFEDIIGTSPVIRTTIDLCRAASKSSSSILLTGESGVGKEVFAQSIHNASERRNGPFIAINCGAISSSLIESELFGYEEGAFTGAVKGGKMGRFEMAHGGTLFLDEIGDMPADMQVKLLRALQENVITRIGGEKVIPIDVRIIAATNKNLEEEISSKTFRLDLFYRLNVFQINIPPLYERKGDIPMLAMHFLNRKATKLNKPMPRLSDELMAKMTEYQWPGNIRELENFIEKAVILAGKVDLYPPREEIGTSPLPEVVNQIPSDVIISLEEAEKKVIINALKKTGRNISKTAKALGIGRNTLYQKMKKHNIE